MNTVLAEEYIKLAAIAEPRLDIGFDYIIETASHGLRQCDYGYFLPKWAKMNIFHREYTRLRTLLYEHFVTLDQRVHLLPESAVKYGCYRIHDGHLVGSLWSQRANGINLASNYIRCQPVWDNPDRPTFFYAEVVFFMAITMADLPRFCVNGPLQEPATPEEVSNQFDHHLAVVKWWETEASDEGDGNR